MEMEFGQYFSVEWHHEPQVSDVFLPACRTASLPSILAMGGHAADVQSSLTKTQLERGRKFGSQVGDGTDKEM